MKLLIKFPSRSRKHKFFSAIENIQSLIGIDDYLISANLDLDDLAMNNAEVKEQLREYDNLVICWGLSTNKICAVNRSIPMNIAWEYLLVTSDDMHYIKKDFGKTIVESFNIFPNAGLLHFPDQKQKERLITLPLMTREYYEETNYVYHPEYISVKADMEQMIVAKKKGKYQYVDISIVVHQHPRWGFETDEQYKIQDGQNMYARDGVTFAKREAANFDL